MNRVLQPRPLVVLGLNVWMGTAAGADELVEIPYREWEQLETFDRLFPASQGHDEALTVLHVPNSPNSFTRVPRLKENTTP